MSLIDEHPSRPIAADEENLYTHSKIPLHIGIFLFIISLCLNVVLYKDTTAKTENLDSLKNEAYNTKKELGELRQKVDIYYSKQKTAVSYLETLGYSSVEIDIITNSIASPFLTKLVIDEKIANGESLTEQEQNILNLLQ